MNKEFFKSNRLVIKQLSATDKGPFNRLLSDSAIVSAIPQPPFTDKEIDEKFRNSINQKINVLDNRVRILGVYLINTRKLVGLCAFLTNNENDKELGYRFLEEYWGQGFATELTKAAIDFCFEELKIKKLTADVAVNNIASAKVLDKFFTPVKEFYNPNDDCIDRRYELFNSN